MAQFPSTTSASGIWTLSKQKRAEQGDNWPFVPQADTYFEYTTLLLPGNGTNGAQNNTFLDSSTNAYSITRNGNPTQGTFSPFSQTGWSNYFDGTGDYLQTSNSSEGFEFTTGEFTIEFWINSTQTTRCDPVGMNYNYSDSGWCGFIFNLSSSGDMAWYENTNSRISASSTGWNNGQWNHVALTRSGNSVRMFLNGTQVGSTYTTSFTYGGANKGVIVGTLQQDPASAYVNGYISNLRIVKGSAVYTANFTPPTVALTAISGTSLLTCQSNRFIDSSAGALALTVNGNPSVQAFSPFNPSAAYSTATNGGSGYFDGTGDYLYALGANLVVGTGTFTLEWWIYLPTSPGDWKGTVNIGDGAWYTSGRLTPLIAAGAAYLRTSLGTTYTDYYFNNAPFRVGQWNHVAIQRETSGTVLAYCNGRVATSGSLSGSGVNLTTDEISVAISDQGNLAGYISNIRLTRGSAVYGSTYTVPTAPVTGGSLLLNFTNAGIYDATAKSDFETVSGAQISTTQNKFGSGSIYFDGNGDWLLGSVNDQRFGFGTKDFTIEFWAWKSANGVSGYDAICGSQNGGTPTWFLELSTSRGFLFYDRATAATCSNGTTTGINDSTWHHWAICRSSGTWYLFKDGVALTKTTDSIGSNSLAGGTSFYVGNELDGGTNYSFNGYIQDLRITKGIARYTSNFTPPTAAFPLF